VSNLEKRIEKLEQHTETGEPEHKTWVVFVGESLPDGVAGTDTVIRVLDERTKQLTLRVLAGERTERGESNAKITPT